MSIPHNSAAVVNISQGLPEWPGLPGRPERPGRIFRWTRPGRLTIETRLVTASAINPPTKKRREGVK